MANGTSSTPEAQDGGTPDGADDGPGMPRPNSELVARLQQENAEMGEKLRGVEKRVAAAAAVQHAKVRRRAGLAVAHRQTDRQTDRHTDRQTDSRVLDPRGLIWIAPRVIKARPSL
jgi:hypothetical protein